MATKMYLLVEADQSHADPVSRLMTELVDQLKTNPSGIRDVRILSSNKDEHSSNVSKHDTSTHNVLQVAHQPHHSSSDDHHHDEKKPRAEFICGPDGGDKPLRAAITAEACVDSAGRAQAKLIVCTDQGKTQDSIVCYPTKKETKDELPPCGKRNGLDPTPAELRGCKKFEYLPHKSKIPEYTSKSKRPKSIALSDHLSNGSIYSGSKSRRNSSVYPGGLKKNCPANVPEARLHRYNACINRRNGLQDRCDPLSKNALKGCYKSKK